MSPCAVGDCGDDGLAFVGGEGVDPVVVDGSVFCGSAVGCLEFGDVHRVVSVRVCQRSHVQL